MLYDAYIMLSHASALLESAKSHTASFGPVLGGSSCFGLKDSISFECKSKSVQVGPGRHQGPDLMRHRRWMEVFLWMACTSPSLALFDNSEQYFPSVNPKAQKNAESLLRLFLHQNFFQITQVTWPTVTGCLLGTLMSGQPNSSVLSSE